MIYIESRAYYTMGLVKLIPGSRRHQSYILWTIFGVTHSQVWFFLIIISYGTDHRILGAFRELNYILVIC